LVDFVAEIEEGELFGDPDEGFADFREVAGIERGFHQAVKIAIVKGRLAIFGLKIIGKGEGLVF